jgi:hypothetical protein
LIGTARAIVPAGRFESGCRDARITFHHCVVREQATDAGAFDVRGEQE